MSRSSRVLTGLLLAATLVAGCQCAAPPPKLSTSAMKPFVGGWGAHASDMRIRGDGLVQLEVQVTSLTPGYGSDFPRWDMQVTSATSKRLEARVTWSDSPRVKVGWKYVITQHAYGLKLSGPLGGRVFCDSYNREHGNCGA
jgi:hypothetical protein